MIKEKRRMLFGEFLVARGKIKPRDVDRILNIQKESILPLGKLAIENKFMTLADIITIRSHQKGTNSKFGEVAINLDILKPRQVDSLLQLQSDLKPYFGELLVKNKLLKQEEFLNELNEFKNSHGTMATPPNRIVLLDIEEPNASVMEREFQNLGYKAVAIPYSPETFDGILDEPPEYLIIDLRRRKEEKFKMLQRMRAEFPAEETKVLALVSKLTASDREEAAKAGISEFAPSAAVPKNIVQYVQGILDSRYRERAGSVLLVDDSPTALKLMAHFLEIIHYETWLAPSAEGALKMLERISPDLILTDLHMPGMNGIELCKQVKSNPKTRNVPVVLVTTAKAIVRLKEALEAGASDYIVKPFQQDELIARVRSHIKTKRLIDDLQEFRRELLMTNERLAEANERKTEFLATVAHDLRTPLTSIRTYSELLTMREMDVKTQKEFIGVIKGEAIRMSGLIRNYLDVSRMESISVAHKKEKVDLTGMSRYFEKIYSAMAKNKTIRFLSELPEETLYFLGDQEHFEQVLANLLDNAVKFTPPGGTITFSVTTVTKKSRKYGEIMVRDTGKGIPEEAQQYIFKKFHHLHNELQPIQGTGLGLSICKQIVEWHNGRIELESEAGKGALFRVLIPLLSEES